MPTPNQLSGLNFQNNLVLNGLDSPDRVQMVYDLSNGYNTLDMLMSLMNKQKSTQVTGRDGIYEKPIMGKSRVIAQIASNALVGANMKLVFFDTNYDLFRIKDTVIDSSANQTMGRVIAKGPGFIVMEPVEGAWNPAINYVANSYAFSAWDASGNRGSGGKTSLFEQPIYVKNRTAILRETVEISRRDMFKTWVEYQGDFWYSSQDQIAVQRFARMQEYRDWFSKSSVIAGSSVEGDVNYNGGLKWAVTDPIRGGVYKPLSNAMTQGDFEDFLGNVADKQAATNVKLNLLVGRSALRQIQSFTTPFVQFAGKANTFGGEAVKGLDVYEYSFGGIETNLIMCPIFNDIDAFPQTSTINGVKGTKMQNTIVALDSSSYEAVGGGMLPAMERIYFGEEEYIYGYVPGLIGKGGVDPSNVMQSGKIFATSDKDSVSLQLYTDSGIDVIANRMGWMELAF